jgi:hypothetical protein
MIWETERNITICAFIPKCHRLPFLVWCIWDTMRAYRIEGFESVDGVVLGSRDDPQPGIQQILVQVRATSLNYRDLMVLKGGGRGPTKLGVVPLSDGAGYVAAAGDGVTRFAVGDRVIGCFHPRTVKVSITLSTATRLSDGGALRTYRPHHRASRQTDRSAGGAGAHAGWPPGVG